MISTILFISVLLYIPYSGFVLEFFDCTVQKDGTLTLDAGGLEKGYFF